MRTKFIVIEGTDGSGKQTQTKLLEKNLVELGYKVKRISFPDYESKGSEPVKMFLNGDLGSIDNISYYASSALFAVDRYTSFKTNWEEEYNKGYIIICDRYTISNIIHQGNRIEDENEFWDYCKWIVDLEWNKFKLPKPDKIVFLDVPYNFSNELMKNRPNKITGKLEKDILESDEEQKKRAYETLNKIAEKFNFTRLSCVEKDKLKSIDVIQNELIDIIKEIIE